MPTPPRKSIARSLGEFFGHIIKGAGADVSRDRKVVSQKVEEQTKDTPEGKVTLRRTTIEEVELHRSREKDLGAGDGGGGGGSGGARREGGGSREG
ncbi:MAG: hypothetical protein KF745_14870 [Phycisphaeraceae bacterium]|nr:hypothetical protein [Phycisphaeraceae bacterium]